MLPLQRIHRLGRSVSRVTRTRYPRFLFGMPLRRDEIPVFTYHDVAPGVFAGDLEFLRENGYRTLTASELVADDSGRAGDGPAVVLTFDDARRSFHDVALPLLQEYDARATLFVPTAWITDDDGISEAAPSPNGLFMSWRQLRACAASGRVDVQSHSHRHALVYASRQLVDFVSPRTLSRYDIYDWPMRHERGTDRFGRPPAGTPVYQATPLLSAGYRILEDERVSAACRAAVEAGGGEEAFFRRTDWRSRLLTLHDKNLGSSSHTATRRIPDDEFNALVASDITQSAQRLHQELGVRPDIFAYPWMLGSDHSLAIAAEAGFIAAFGVGIDYGRARKIPGPLRVFGRLKADWLRFLPGVGRARLHRVLPAKTVNFFRYQHLAH